MPDVVDAPTRGNCNRRACPGRTVLAHVTGRYGSLVVAALGRERVLRFSELRARIEGISDKMLSQTLRELERDGLIARHDFRIVPPRVEYALTPLGRGVAGHVEALIDWIETNVAALVEARGVPER